MLEFLALASGGSSAPAATSATTGAKPAWAPKPAGTTSGYGKSPAEQDSIKRQAIMHAVSRALIALQGQVSPDNIEEVAAKLYKKFQELVG